MHIEEINRCNRARVNEFLQKHWFSTDMVVRGKIIDMTVVDGYIMLDDDEIIGLVTYTVSDSECEILSLDSIKENIGIGSQLVNCVVDKAKQLQCNKIKLITTNDNLNAMKFYQKRGFETVKIYPNAVTYARTLKPSIPLIGNYGIPLKHEIEFEMKL